jgi:excinuclease ABC subunit C
MLNADGELVYIGKAKSLRARLLCYFRPRSRDPKAGRILQHTRGIVWEFAPSEFAALLRELELIRRWRPRLNVQGQPNRRFRSYVCLGRQPAPYVFLARWPAASAQAIFGPVFGGRKARAAVRWLNDWFKLRDCPQSQQMIFADQTELFPMLRTAGCLRHEIGTCLGPCIAACTHAHYLECVRAAQAFLDGTDDSLLQALESEMSAASAALAFEWAAAVRDKLDVLRWLHAGLERVRRAREEHSFIYPVRGFDEHDLWYLIHRGRVVLALPPPRMPLDQAVAARTIDRVYRSDDAWIGPPASEVIDGVLLIAAWFRRHPEERERVLDPARLLSAWRRAAEPVVPGLARD